jgi:ligand-binding sensor domain-containing protein/signal transduction histidine kinase
VPIPVPVLLCAGLIAFLLAPTVAAQYRVDVWTTETGLPQNSVMAIDQTRDGYLWLATNGGLVRFDGAKFTLFDVGNPLGLRSTRIQALYEDRAGALWIGTAHGGLTRYADGTFRTYTKREGLPVDSVSFICEDRKGRFWLATAEGLVRFEAGRFTLYTTRDGLPSNPISQIAEDRQGDLWIGTQDGLVRFSGDRFTTLTTRDGLPDNGIRAILPRRDGSVWLGMALGGVARLQAARVKAIYTVSDGLPSNTVRALYEDRSGALWVATNEGVGRLAPDGVSLGQSGNQVNSPPPQRRAFVAFTQDDGLSDDNIHSLLEDREGNFWVGTNTGGLNRLKTRQLTAFGRAEGLPGDGIVPITEDAEGSLWIGMTCGGLVRYAKRVFTTYGIKDGLPTECVWTLLADREGRLWIGTWGGGLTLRHRDGRFTTYTEATSGLSNDAVLSLFQDRAGTLWVGTGAGLNRLKDGVFTVYRTSNGLVHDDVRFITEDRQGALWIGTTGGASRFKDGTFTNYTTEQGLSYNFVRAIHETADGTLWFGTYGGGLNRFKNGRFTQLTTRHGLFENVISRILEDDDGNFWMTGNKGIVRVKRQELDALAEGKPGAITPVVYGVGDGMRSSECNGGGQPAGWKGRDGRLWFPTAKGLVMADPKRITSNTVPPSVLIERVLVNKREQAAQQDVRVPPGAGEMEIHYTGLSFSAPEHVRFRYKLAGLDVNWTDAGTRRTAYFSRVPPGRYTFTVSAANRDSVWSTADATLRFQVIPPFYRTWWFMAFAAVGASGLAFAIHDRRVRQLTKAKAAQEAFSRRLIESQESERKRIAAELHDSLGQTLIVIKNRALLTRQTPEDHKRAFEQIDEIADAATHAIEEVREISYNLRPYHLDRLGLTRAIAAMLERVSKANGLRITKDLDELDGLLSNEDEINVYRIVQEGVTNIVKHAAATEAGVAIKREAGRVRIMIRDNGKGFSGDGTTGLPRDGSGDERGFGLIGIAERARLMSSEPIIRSALGRGTTIEITLDSKEPDGDRGQRSDRG